MNIEDITTDDDNRRILSSIKTNKEGNYTELYIQNEHEIEIDEEDDDEVSVDVGYVPEGTKDMGWLGYFVGKNNHLKQLYIRDFEPTSGASVIEVLESFLRGVNNNRSIRALDFTDVDLMGGRVFTILESFFRDNNNLFHFSICDCHLGDDGWRLLALALGSSKHQSLRNVALMNNNISDEGMVDIITSLSMHPRLKHIDLSWNRLNKNGCIALATLLQNSATELWHLDLGNNELDDEGIDALVPVLSKCTKLDELYIDDNPSITPRGWQHLANILKAPASNLETLSINRNNIDDQVLTFMIDALANNNTLVSLFFMDGNQVTAKGWEALSKLLCDESSDNSTFLSNHTLNDIDFSKKNISQDLRPLIRTLRLRSVLALNVVEDKKQVAIIKTYRRNFRNLDMLPFFEWEFKILPLMIDWLEKAFIACNNEALGGEYSASEMARHEARHRSVQLSCIYQFVRDILSCVFCVLRIS